MSAWASLVIALIALLFSVAAAIFSWRRSREERRDAELLRLGTTFDTAGYRIRFWRLGLAVREAILQARELDPALQDQSFLLSPEPPLGGTMSVMAPWYPAQISDGVTVQSPEFRDAMQSVFSTYTGSGEQSILADFIGPPLSTGRADFADFWYLCLRFWYWVEDSDAPWWAFYGRKATRIRKNADRVTRMLGNALVLTMSGHHFTASRFASCKLGKDSLSLPSTKRYSRNYFRRHYGLSDERCAFLIDVLAESGNRLGVLTDDHRKAIRKTESLLEAERYREDPSASERPLRPKSTLPSDWINS